MVDITNNKIKEELNLLVTIKSWLSDDYIRKENQR